MNKSGLIKELAEELNTSHKLSDEFLNIFIRVFKNSLKREGKIAIYNFGVFEIKIIKESERRNPKTGQPVIVPRHLKIKFKQSKNYWN